MTAANPEHELAQDQAKDYFVNLAKIARGKGMTDKDLGVKKGTLKGWAEGKNLPMDDLKQGQYSREMRKFNESL